MNVRFVSESGRPQGRYGLADVGCQLSARKRSFAAMSAKDRF